MTGHDRCDRACPGVTGHDHRCLPTWDLPHRVGKANQGKFSTAVTVLDKTSLQVPQGARCAGDRLAPAGWQGGKFSQLS